MREIGQAKPMNTWEKQFYRQLSHTEADDIDVDRSDEWFTYEGEVERHAALDRRQWRRCRRGRAGTLRLLLCKCGL